jgi:hypothetical protein
MEKWLWQWKWALVIAIFAGPAFSYYSYTQKQRLEHIMAAGADLTAQVESVEIHHGRYGSRSYRLHALWEANGQPQQAWLNISDQFAERIILDNQVMIETVALKVAPSEADAVLVAPDGPQQIRNQQLNFWLGIIAGIAGLIISPIVFWFERRQKRARDDDIDATLARMRAGNPQQT